jgi:hypothetical protein
MTENCKLRKAILSAFYNISQRNFGILLRNIYSFKLWWYFCLDQNLVYNANGPLKNLSLLIYIPARSCACIIQLVESLSTHSFLVDQLPDYNAYNQTRVKWLTLFCLNNTNETLKALGLSGELCSSSSVFLFYRWLYLSLHTAID